MHQESESDDSDSGSEQVPVDQSASGSIGSKSYSPPPKMKAHRTKAEILQDIVRASSYNLLFVILPYTVYTNDLYTNTQYDAK